ncbi:MAG: ATP-binding protein [Pseudomonadota bacterium]
MLIQAEDNSEISARKNLTWLFVLRNLMIAGEAIIIFISVYGLNISLQQKPLWVVVLISVIINALTRLRLRSTFPVSDIELFGQLVIDVFIITALLYFTGGATNPIVWFFLLPLIITATILPQNYTWYMVILTTSCYTVLIGNHIPLPSIQPDLPAQPLPPQVMAITDRKFFDLHMFGMWFGFVFSAGLVAYFILAMANTLRERDRKLAHVRENALRDERVIAVGTLAAGAAHEMGTPLGTMAILTHEIEQDYPADKYQDLNEKMLILKEQIKRCKEALSVMSASAGEMRAESGHVMPVDAYLNEVIALWRAQKLSANLEFRVDGEQPTPNILADRTLTHSLVNLLNNAVDASPHRVELDAAWKNLRLTINVRDYGPGLTPHIAAAAGKIPISTKEKGLGVGLFLAFAAIERLGGKLELLNLEDGGTCTHVEIPLLATEIS